MSDTINHSTMLPVGAELNGRYRIVRYLSSGGFGNTYEATNEFDETVAIKEFFMKGVNERRDDHTTVNVSNDDNRKLFERQRSKFYKEAKRLRKLDNQHIVKVQSFFEENGTAYYVMDYIDGESLDQVVKRDGFMPEQEVWNIRKEMLDALNAIHAAGIYHLDIKPENIMRDGQGHVHLIDFGASKQQDPLSGGGLSTAMPAFTRGYAPIEQVEGNIDKIGAHTDLYSLGATLYKLVTGNNPPQYSNIISGGKSVFNFPERVSEKMQKMIVWMMMPNYKQRPQSVEEIRKIYPDDNPSDDDTKVQNHEGSIDNKKNDSKSKKWIYVLVACLAICIGAVCWWILRPPIVPPPDGLSGKALEYYQKAKEGDEKAQYELACCYRDGLGAPKDSTEAMLFWAQRAVDKKFPEAYSFMGYVYADGLGVSRNDSIAEDWYKKAYAQARPLAEKGDARAQRVMGWLYFQGVGGLEKNDSSAASWYRKSAEQDYWRAQWFLGYCYINGYGVPKDYKQAVDWFRKAAEKDYAKAQNSLGDCYYLGKGVNKDYSQAVSWYRKAAEQGYSEAQLRYGNCFTDGTGVARDYVQAVGWYLEAAERGNEVAQDSICSMFFYKRILKSDSLKKDMADKTQKLAEKGVPWAQDIVGELYQQGVGGYPKDIRKCVDWYTKSANNGNAWGQVNLGIRYLEGEGVAKDDSQRVLWYRKSAEQGNAEAQYRLGLCFYGCRDYNQAVDWFRKAALQGHRDAQDWIGSFYEHGYGVTQDYKQAVEWYRRAVAQGQNLAQYNLGKCYELGNGVEKDKAKAIELYRKAAKQGVEAAENILKKWGETL